jgi:hypothetical protein
MDTLEAFAVGVARIVMVIVALSVLGVGGVTL